jgi:hypothetical protein
MLPYTILCLNPVIIYKDNRGPVSFRKCLPFGPFHGEKEIYSLILPGIAILMPFADAPGIIRLWSVTVKKMFHFCRLGRRQINILVPDYQHTCQSQAG